MILNGEWERWPPFSEDFSVKMKLAWGLTLALSGVEANNCDVTQSDTCPCNDVKWKKAKVGGKAASKIEKRGATSVEMRMGIANTIIDRVHDAFCFLEFSV